ncbi:hypothetical protein H920_18023 [Fukomys damarensis]|uniref:Uncharacterized protein n=1 Tax=Fukomys damarensis TaxID=885580 RepID=A0A091CRV6_FUKDA|nr:hypothetical protein H920_18023 [Fukomys damarensis]
MKGREMNLKCPFYLFMAESEESRENEPECFTLAKKKLLNELLAVPKEESYQMTKKTPSSEICLSKLQVYGLGIVCGHLGGPAVQALGYHSVSSLLACVSLQTPPDLLQILVSCRELPLAEEKGIGEDLIYVTVDSSELSRPTENLVPVSGALRLIPFPVGSREGQGRRSQARLTRKDASGFWMAEGIHTSDLQVCEPPGFRKVMPL